MRLIDWRNARRRNLDKNQPVETGIMALQCATTYLPIREVPCVDFLTAQSTSALPKFAISSFLDMARVRSPEKRSAILQAAVHEIAETGLSAATAKIADRAGVASGTLFTYFATKEELLNELYLELKIEAYTRINDSFPHKASLEHRARHIWTTYIDWAIESPEKRKVSALLHMSNLITPKTRARTSTERGAVDETLAELESREALRELPPGFAATTMSAMQDATMDFIAKQPRQRKALIERTFHLFWRAVR